MDALAAVSTPATGGVQAAVTVAVLASALAHATWNAIAAAIKDKLVAFTVLGMGSLALALPMLAWVPVPVAASWPFLVASAAVHVAYNVLLMQSYRVGDFSQVYPLARGTSPLVVTVIAALFVGERLTVPQLAGVVVVSAGLASLALVGRRPGREDWPAVTAALGTGLAIATYTVVDGVGVRLSGDALGYIVWLSVLHAAAIPVGALCTRGRALVAQVRPYWVHGLLGGALSLLAYGLVLWAQTRGALAPIAALRESSIIFGAVIGAVWFHERFGPPRVVAAVLVSAGIVLLNVP
ncbi:MAG: EamA family transporter [Actinomycetes bacterium]